MKKDSLKKVFSAIAMTAVAVSATSVNAFADARGGLTDEQIENASVKPKITASKITLTLDEAKDIIANNNGQVTWTVFVNDADAEYCSTGIHVYYDDRLELALNARGKEMIVKGEAGVDLSQSMELDNENAADYPAHTGNVTNTAKTAGMEGFFVATAGQANDGYDGDLWNVTVTLPSVGE